MTQRKLGIKSKGGKRPFRVLDLACGVGLVRVAVAERVPTREIRYTAIDSSRPRLRRVELLTRPAARTIPAEQPLGRIPESAPPSDLQAIQARLKERFIRTELELTDPKLLATQLSALLGRERFDEVHVHLLHPSKHGVQITGPRVLQAVGKYLRPGGRLYHLFQHSSPFFDFKPERIRLPTEVVGPAAGPRAGALEINKQSFAEGACKAGLSLDRCGHRWQPARSKSEGEVVERAKSVWLTRRFAGTAPDRRPAETYNRLAEQYSGFSAYATHFVILRKPRKSERARRSRSRA